MIDTQKLKGFFISELQDNLNLLDEGLLKVEKKDFNNEDLNTLMRASHTIKGSAATMKYENVQKLAHKMEDFFDSARKGKRKITPDVLELLFDSVDELKEVMESIKTNDEEKDLSPLITDLDNRLNGKKVKRVSEKKVKTDELEKIDFIKVDVEKIDRLMELIEELVVERMKLENTLSKKESESSELKETLSFLSRLISDLQYQVMNVRLVPADHLFARFPRMVRDMANEDKKSVDFEVQANNLELDRSVIDKLGEPLIHMIRNAMDHGIVEKGKITLTAQRDKDKAIISIEDNGAGINWGEVINTAVSKEIISEELASTYLEDMDSNIGDIKSLILNPNLSTKKKITKTSGRGVGMYIVNDFVAKNNGFLDIVSPVSDKGGTKITMQIPLSVSIVKALIVRVGEESYAIPFTIVNRSVKIESKDVKSMGDQDVAIISEEEVPLIHTDKVLGIKSSKEKIEDKTVVLIGDESISGGVVVDEILTEEEIVVKPLSNVINDNLGFSGYTILGDGKLVLIFDISSLVRDKVKLIR